MWRHQKLSRQRALTGNVLEVGRYSTNQTLVRLLKDWAEVTPGELVVDLRGCIALPTGFFGMLHTLAQEGREVVLRRPHPDIQGYLWFKCFCTQVDNRDYRMEIGEC